MDKNNVLNLLGSDPSDLIKNDGNFAEKESDDQREIAVYLRVSSYKQKMTELSLRDQRKKIIAYLDVFDLRDNQEINVYSDDGYSASNLNRPALKEIIKKVSEKRIKSIFIYKLDRLSRNVLNVYQLLSFLLKNDCDLIALADNINIKSANGRLFVGMLALVAQWESEVDRERTLSAKGELVAQGLYPHGTLPYGMMRGENKTVVYREKPLYTIKLIYKLLYQGIVQKEIERILADRTDCDTLGVDSIKRIAKDRRYLGEFYYEGQVYYNILPRAIDQETFDYVQIMQNKRFKHRDDSKYYFGNKVYCSNENTILIHEMTKKKDKNYYYYTSSTSKKRINQNTLIEQSLHRIFTHINDKDLKTTISVKDKRLKNLDQKITRLYDKYRISKINEREYLIALLKLDRERESLMKEIKFLIKNDFIKWQKLNDFERKTFINNHVERIIVDLDLKVILSIDYL